MARSRLVVLGSTILLGALIFAACGSDEVSDSAAPNALIGDASAQQEDATGDDTVTSTTEAATAISFANDVQHIIETNCVSCHSDTGPGTTHLVMETVDDVASIAEFISIRVEDRQMPPWPLSGLQEVSFQYDLSMTDEDRQTIIDWAAAGAPLDVEATTPLAATSQTYPPIDADLVLYADGAYPGSDRTDDYRCRILDPEFTDESWVTSIETRPDETRVLHHSLIYRLPAELRGEADELDGSDGNPGWLCQTVPRLSDGLLEQVAGWAPGTGPITMPEGSGLRMDAGDTFVVQWHYHYDTEALPDNSGIALELASPEEVEAAGGSLDPISNPSLIGPAEIPCASFESGPLCDRSAAIARLSQEFGFESALISEFINRRCGVSAEDFAHFTDGVASSSCDIDAPTGQVVSMWPHMHELGTTYRLTLNPDTPEERLLIDIDRWDFQWQMGYYPDETLEFAEGDVLRVECGWDRALWPAGLESRYIVWAEGTQDEMCFTGLAIR